ncbi:hypothetical protein L7F22_012085 [Adiantum nelumboides]|nr:hypothetical protein [Adiantum nelumboides]
MAFCTSLHTIQPLPQQLRDSHPLSQPSPFLSAGFSVPRRSIYKLPARKSSAMVRASAQSASAAPAEAATRHEPASKAAPPLRLTYLEGNSWLWNVLGLQILVDPVLVGNLDFGIPWLYDASKKTLKEFQGAAAQLIPILPPPSLPDPPASPVITPSTSHPVPPIQPPDVSPDHALSDSDSDLDVADATPEVDLAPPRREKRIPGWLYSTGITEVTIFQTLKDKMTTGPVLILPDLRKSFELYCDAFGRSLGAVLMQEGRVIAYESRMFSKPEMTAQIYEKELLAVIHALTQWRHSLLGADFTVFTDNQSLRYFLSQKQLSEKQMRWANILSQFHFQIVHVQGQKNVVADALSRKPLVQAISAIHRSTFEDMIDQYATDLDFADIFARIRDGETVAGYSLREGYLMRKTMLCVTQPLREKVMTECHCPLYTGHRGIATTMKGVERYFYWPRLKKDVEEFVRSCLLEDLPDLDLLLITQNFDDHCHERTLRPLSEMFPDLQVISTPNAEPTLSKLFGKVIYLEPGHSTVFRGRNASEIVIRASSGPTLGPPWQRPENGYFVEVKDPKFSLYYEPHCVFDRSLMRHERADVVITPVIKQVLPLYTLVSGQRDAVDLVKLLQARFVVPLQNGDLESKGILSKLVNTVGSVQDFRELLEKDLPAVEVLEAKPGMPLDVPVGN